MTSIPQLRRDINELRVKMKECERERDAYKARPVKEVPGPERVVTREVVKEVPCPEQAAQIASLQARLDEFADCDMNEFRQWRSMRAVAEGK